MASLRLISEFVIPSRRCAAASRIFSARSTAIAGLTSERGMAISYKFPLCPQYRIHVQNIEQAIARIRRLGYHRTGRAEQMFNMLNKRTGKGKNSPMVCKFLSWMPAFPHGLLIFLQRPCYLLERMDF